MWGTSSRKKPDAASFKSSRRESEDSPKVRRKLISSRHPKRDGQSQKEQRTDEQQPANMPAITSNSGPYLREESQLMDDHRVKRLQSLQKDRAIGEEWKLDIDTQATSEASHGKRKMTSYSYAKEAQPRAERSVAMEDVTTRAGPPSNADLPSTIPNQFPGQAPLEFALPYRPPNTFGAAAEYYGDQGESVAQQPGMRPTTPMITGTEAHLTPALPIPAPTVMAGAGSAAEFHASSGPALGRPNLPHSTSAPINSVNYEKPPQPPSVGVSQGVLAPQAPPHPNLIGSGLQPHAPVYAAAAGAAGVAAVAWEQHQQHSLQTVQPVAHSDPSHQQIHMHESGSHVEAHFEAGSDAQQGPLHRLVEWWRNYEDVRKMEEYSEYIGICRHCFEPGSAARKGPREHRPRKHASRESLSRTRVDKESRYQPSDVERRFKGDGILTNGGVSARKTVKANRAPKDHRTDIAPYQNVDHKPGSIRRRSRGERQDNPFQGDIRINESLSTKIAPALSSPPMRTAKHTSRSSKESTSDSDERRTVRFSSTIATTKNRQDTQSAIAQHNSIDHHVVSEQFKRSGGRNSSPPALFPTSAGIPAYNQKRSRKTTVVYNYGSSAESNENSGFFSKLFTGPRRRKDSSKRLNAEKLQRSSSMDTFQGHGSPHIKSERSQKTPRGGAGGTLLGLGAAAALLSAANLQANQRNNRRADVVAVREQKMVPRVHTTSSASKTSAELASSSSEDVWESADEESDESSNVSSGLAYGDFVGRGRKSSESLSSDSSFSRIWGWRSKRRKDRVLPRTPAKSQRQNNVEIRAHSNSVSGYPPRLQSTTSHHDQANIYRHEPLQQVEPRPISESSSVEGRHGSSKPVLNSSIVSTSHNDHVTLQQPKPISPTKTPSYAIISEYKSRPEHRDQPRPANNRIAQIRTISSAVQAGSAAHASLDENSHGRLAGQTGAFSQMSGNETPDYRSGVQDVRLDDVSETKEKSGLDSSFSGLRLDEDEHNHQVHNSSQLDTKSGVKWDMHHDMQNDADNMHGVEGQSVGALRYFIPGESTGKSDLINNRAVISAPDAENQGEHSVYAISPTPIDVSSLTTSESHQTTIQPSYHDTLASNHGKDDRADELSPVTHAAAATTGSEQKMTHDDSSGIGQGVLRYEIRTQRSGDQVEPIFDDDIFDPDFFKKRFSGGASQEVTTCNEDEYSVFADFEERYKEVPTNMADFFAPPELLSRTTLIHAVVRDNDSVVNTLDTADQPGSQVDIFTVNAMSRVVPRLNVIAPTPPVSAAQSVRGSSSRHASPTRSFTVIEIDQNPSDDSDDRARTASQHADIVHYQVITPHGHHEERSYFADEAVDDNSQLPTSPLIPAVFPDDTSTSIISMVEQDGIEHVVKPLMPDESSAIPLSRIMAQQLFQPTPSAEHSHVQHDTRTTMPVVTLATETYPVDSASVERENGGASAVSSDSIDTRKHSIPDSVVLREISHVPVVQATQASTTDGMDLSSANDKQKASVSTTAPKIEPDDSVRTTRAMPGGFDSDDDLEPASGIQSYQPPSAIIESPMLKPVTELSVAESARQRDLITLCEPPPNARKQGSKSKSKRGATDRKSMEQSSSSSVQSPQPEGKGSKKSKKTKKQKSKKFEQSSSEDEAMIDDEAAYSVAQTRDNNRNDFENSQEYQETNEHEKSGISLAPKGQMSIVSPIGSAVSGDTRNIPTKTISPKLPSDGFVPVEESQDREVPHDGIAGRLPNGEPPYATSRRTAERSLRPLLTGDESAHTENDLQTSADAHYIDSDSGTSSRVPTAEPKISSPLRAAPPTVGNSLTDFEGRDPDNNDDGMRRQLEQAADTRFQLEAHAAFSSILRNSVKATESREDEFNPAILPVFQTQSRDSTFDKALETGHVTSNGFNAARLPLFHNLSEETTNGQNVFFSELPQSIDNKEVVAVQCTVLEADRMSETVPFFESIPSSSLEAGYLPNQQSYYAEQHTSTQKVPLSKPDIVNSSSADDAQQLPTAVPLPESRPTSSHSNETTTSPLVLPTSQPLPHSPVSVRSPSSTAVPFRFRRPPQSPGLTRDSPLSSSLNGDGSTPSTTVKPRSGRPNSTEFKSSTEFMPLYLLERNRKVPEPEDVLPSLPSSRTTSRSPSLHNSDGMYESALQSPNLTLSSPTWPLAINTDFETRHGDSSYLDSQQTTPRARSFPFDIGDASSELDTAPVDSLSLNDKQNGTSGRPRLHPTPDSQSSNHENQSAPTFLHKESIAITKDVKSSDMEAENHQHPYSLIPATQWAASRLSAFASTVAATAFNGGAAIREARELSKSGDENDEEAKMRGQSDMSRLDTSSETNAFSIRPQVHSPTTPHAAEDLVNSKQDLKIPPGVLIDLPPDGEAQAAEEVVHKVENQPELTENKHDLLSTQPILALKGRDRATEAENLQADPLLVKDVTSSDKFSEAQDIKAVSDAHHETAMPLLTSLRNVQSRERLTDGNAPKEDALHSVSSEHDDPDVVEELLSYSSSIRKATEVEEMETTDVSDLHLQKGPRSTKAKKGRKGKQKDVSITSTTRQYMEGPYLESSVPSTSERQPDDRASGLSYSSDVAQPENDVNADGAHDWLSTTKRTKKTGRRGEKSARDVVSKAQTPLDPIQVVLPLNHEIQGFTIQDVDETSQKQVDLVVPDTSEISHESDKSLITRTLPDMHGKQSTNAAATILPENIALIPLPESSNEQPTQDLGLQDQSRCEDTAHSDVLQESAVPLHGQDFHAPAAFENLEARLEPESILKPDISQRVLDASIKSQGKPDLVPVPGRHPILASDAFAETQVKSEMIPLPELVDKDVFETSGERQIQPEMIALPEASETELLDAALESERVQLRSDSDTELLDVAIQPELIPLPEGVDEDLFDRALQPECVPLPEDSGADIVDPAVEPQQVPFPDNPDIELIDGTIQPESIPLPGSSDDDLFAVALDPERKPLPEGSSIDVLNVAVVPGRMPLPDNSDAHLFDAALEQEMVTFPDHATPDLSNAAADFAVSPTSNSHVHICDKPTELLQPPADVDKDICDPSDQERSKSLTMKEEMTSDRGVSSPIDDIVSFPEEVPLPLDVDDDLGSDKEESTKLFLTHNCSAEVEQDGYTAKTPANQSSTRLPNMSTEQIPDPCVVSLPEDMTEDLQTSVDIDVHNDVDSPAENTHSNRTLLQSEHSTPLEAFCVDASMVPLPEDGDVGQELGAELRTPLNAIGVISRESHAVAQQTDEQGAVATSRVVVPVDDLEISLASLPPEPQVNLSDEMPISTTIRNNRKSKTKRALSDTRTATVERKSTAIEKANSVPSVDKPLAKSIDWTDHGKKQGKKRRKDKNAGRVELHTNLKHVAENLNSSAADERPSAATHVLPLLEDDSQFVAEDQEVEGDKPELLTKTIEKTATPSTSKLGATVLGAVASLVTGALSMSALQQDRRETIRDQPSKEHDEQAGERPREVEVSEELVKVSDSTQGEDRFTSPASPVDQVSSLEGETGQVRGSIQKMKVSAYERSPAPSDKDTALTPETSVTGNDKISLIFQKVQSETPREEFGIESNNTSYSVEKAVIDHDLPVADGSQPVTGVQQLVKEGEPEHKDDQQDEWPGFPQPIKKKNNKKEQRRKLRTDKIALSSEEAAPMKRALEDVSGQNSADCENKEAIDHDQASRASMPLKAGSNFSTAGKPFSGMGTLESQKTAETHKDRLDPVANTMLEEVKDDDDEAELVPTLKKNKKKSKAKERRADAHRSNSERNARNPPSQGLLMLDNEAEHKDIDDAVRPRIGAEKRAGDEFNLVSEIEHGNPQDFKTQDSSETRTSKSHAGSDVDKGDNSHDAGFNLNSLANVQAGSIEKSGAKEQSFSAPSLQHGAVNASLETNSIKQEQVSRQPIVAVPAHFGPNTTDTTGGKPTLFEDAVSAADAGNRSPLPDPVVEALPERFASAFDAIPTSHNNSSGLAEQTTDGTERMIENHDISTNTNENDSKCGQKTIELPIAVGANNSTNPADIEGMQERSESADILLLKSFGQSSESHTMPTVRNSHTSSKENLSKDLGVDNDHDLETGMLGLSAEDATRSKDMQQDMAFRSSANVQDSDCDPTPSTKHKKSKKGKRKSGKTENVSLPRGNRLVSISDAEVSQGDLRQPRESQQDDPNRSDEAQALGSIDDLDLPGAFPTFEENGLMQKEVKEDLAHHDISPDSADLPSPIGRDAEIQAAALIPLPVDDRTSAELAIPVSPSKPTEIVYKALSLKEIPDESVAVLSLDDGMTNSVVPRHPIPSDDMPHTRLAGRTSKDEAPSTSNAVRIEEGLMFQAAAVPLPDDKTHEADLTRQWPKHEARDTERTRRNHDHIAQQAASVPLPIDDEVNDIGDEAQVLPQDALSTHDHVTVHDEEHPGQFPPHDTVPCHVPQNQDDVMHLAINSPLPGDHLPGMKVDAQISPHQTQETENVLPLAEDSMEKSLAFPLIPMNAGPSGLAPRIVGGAYPKSHILHQQLPENMAKSPMQDTSENTAHLQDDSSMKMSLPASNLNAGNMTIGEPVDAQQHTSGKMDFAATLAAGLQDAGFDPTLAIYDQSSQPRKSPPDAKRGTQLPTLIQRLNQDNLSDVIPGTLHDAGFDLGEETAVTNSPKRRKMPGTFEPDFGPASVDTRTQLVRDKESPPLKPSEMWRQSPSPPPLQSPGSEEHTSTSAKSNSNVEIKEVRSKLSNAIASQPSLGFTGSASKRASEAKVELSADKRGIRPKAITNEVRIFIGSDGVPSETANSGVRGVGAAVPGYASSVAASRAADLHSPDTSSLSSKKSKRKKKDTGSQAVVSDTEKASMVPVTVDIRAVPPEDNSIHVQDNDEQPTGRRDSAKTFETATKASKKASKKKQGARYITWKDDVQDPPSSVDSPSETQPEAWKPSNYGSGVAEPEMITVPETQVPNHEGKRPPSDSVNRSGTSSIVTQSQAEYQELSMSQDNRDSGFHGADSPMFQQKEFHREPVRDSGYHDTSPASVNQQFAQQPHVTMSNQDMDRQNAQPGTFSRPETFYGSAAHGDIATFPVPVHDLSQRTWTNTDSTIDLFHSSENPSETPQQFIGSSFKGLHQAPDSGLLQRKQNIIHEERIDRDISQLSNGQQEPGGEPNWRRSQPVSPQMKSTSEQETEIVARHHAANKSSRRMLKNEMVEHGSRSPRLRRTHGQYVQNYPMMQHDSLDTLPEDLQPSPGLDEHPSRSRQPSLVSSSIHSEAADSAHSYARSQSKNQKPGDVSQPQNNTSVRSRPPSVLSNRSGTPTLRRIDRSLSGDLRAASKRGEAQAQATKIEESNLDFGKTQSYDPLKGNGRDRRLDMSEVGSHVTDQSQISNGSFLNPGWERWDDVRTPAQSSSQHQALQQQRNLAQTTNGTYFVGDMSAVTEDRWRIDAAALNQALQARESALREKDSEIINIRQSLQMLQDEIKRLSAHNQELIVANRNLSDDTNERYATLQTEHDHAHQQWQQSARQLDELRQQHGQLTIGMQDVVREEISTALEDKNAEIRNLRIELEQATEQIRLLQRQILASKQDENFLNHRDEDYFDNACQQLCQHVQRWVLRFSKSSDNRICRLSRQVRDDSIETRLDNAILDGSDVDNYLADRVRRRDVFMSVVMTMIWEFIFTRYLFGMDREQRQKLKALEKTLTEVGKVSPAMNCHANRAGSDSDTGPSRAVAQWRATTLTLLSRREAFFEQRAQDTEAVLEEIYKTLSLLLPPPGNLMTQIQDSLRNVLKVAVDLSIEMRTQRAEYIMLPPLQPEYDSNGDLARQVYFNAALMNERSGETISNEELERRQAVVRLVLFPLVVKKGNDLGESDEEVVVSPAQVLVAKPTKEKKVVRVLSGAMSIDNLNRSMQSVAPSTLDLNNIS